MTPNIDTSALAEALAHAEMMAEYYGKSAAKHSVSEAQNIVLIAAGLPPLPVTTLEQKDAEKRDSFQRMADALTQVLAMLIRDEAEAA